MNAERLHAIVTALKQELAQRSTIKNLRNLTNNLNQMIQSNNPSTQQNVVSARATLKAALTNTPSDNFSPTWRQILREIGGENLFGSHLLAEFEDAIEANQMTPAVAHQKLEELLATLEAFSENLNKAADAFAHFHIGSEKLDPGECEIGVLIPRKYVHNQLLDFAGELEELAFVFNTFSEVATGKTDKLEIKTISSSDLLVFLNAGLPFAACMAVAIERVVELYKKLLEIRKLHQDLQKTGVPDDRIAGIEEYANELMETGIEKASVEIVAEFYAGNDKGRKNELTNAVRVSLNRIANRIDQGFNVEVRCEPVTKPPETDAEKEAEEAIATIKAATPSMQFMNLVGQPLLHLPEGIEKAAEAKGAKKKKEGGD